MMRFLLSLAFSVLRFIYQSARGVTTQTTCVQNLFGPPCPDFNTVCKVFLSGVSLETLVHRPGNFLHSRKFLCFFPSFFGIFAPFKWPFLTQVFPQCLLGKFPCPGLSWFKSNLEYSLSHSRWTFPRHIVLISFVLRISMDFGIVKLVRYC